MKITTEELERYIVQLGATFVGFSDVRAAVDPKLAKYPYAITVGIRLSDAIIDEIDDKPTFTYFSHYRSVNFFIDQLTLKIMLFLQEKGYKAYTVPASQSIPDAAVPYSGVFPHKTGAVLSGLGWIGKNGLFIHSKYGPAARLGTVLTDLEVECSNDTILSQCGECNKCVKACPAYALTGNEWQIGMDRSDIVDAQACSTYMNKNFKHIGRGSVCGICINVCPYRN
ncbi:MAG TPA: 4Fe-4S double cluster binding domain-containing protein [Pseudobacteroides sp.]|uniref:4Fe-4S double cluster binding domain-containing protein n=1 Tax=Pseudobacteroides sp. TaxID=1968840 RepID=UPI002F938EA4